MFLCRLLCSVKIQRGEVNIKSHLFSLILLLVASQPMYAAEAPTSSEMRKVFVVPCFERANALINCLVMQHWLPANQRSWEMDVVYEIGNELCTVTVEHSMNTLEIEEVPPSTWSYYCIFSVLLELEESTGKYRLSPCKPPPQRIRSFYLPATELPSDLAEGIRTTFAQLFGDRLFLKAPPLSVSEMGFIVLKINELYPGIYPPEADTNPTDRRETTS